MNRWVLTAVACCATTSCFGQSLTEKPTAADPLIKCRGIVEPTARLKCFDQTSISPAAGAADNGAWLVDEKLSDLDRSRAVTIVLPADKVSVGSSQQQQSAHLAIRCSEKVTAIYVSYSALAANLGNPTIVQYRVGEAPPKSSAWDGSQNNKAYGLWTSQRSIPFIKELLQAPDFFVRGHAQVFGTTEASFKLAGLQEVIKPVREACKW